VELVLDYGQVLEEARVGTGGLHGVIGGGMGRDWGWVWMARESSGQGWDDGDDGWKLRSEMVDGW